MTRHGGQNVYGEQIVAEQLTSITTEVTFQDLSGTQDLVIDGNEDDAFHIQLEANFPTTPTDDIIFAFYSTTDDESETWDNTPFMEVVLTNDNDPHVRSVIVSGVYKFKVTAQRSGSTDTITSADMKIRGRTYK